MNNIFIDVDYAQVFKHGQKIGGDVFLLAQVQDLSAHEPRDSRPAQQGEESEHVVNSDALVDPDAVQNGAHDEQNGKARDTVEDIDDTHDDHVHPLAEISRKAAQNDADDGIYDDNEEAQEHGHPSAVHEPYKGIASVFVRSEDVKAGILAVIAVSERIGMRVDCPLVLLDHIDGELLAVDFGIHRDDRRGQFSRIIDFGLLPRHEERADEGEEQEEQEHAKAHDGELGAEKAL